MSSSPHSPLPSLPSPPPEASVIFPARDEGTNVADTLRSLAEAAVETPFEAIVVDDGSTDGSCSSLRSVYPYKLTVVRTSGLGAAQARNVGARLARGRYVVFCDAHLQFPAGWLDGLLAPLRDAVGAETEADASRPEGPLGGVCPGITVPGEPARAGFGETWDDHLEVKWLKPPEPMSKPGYVPLLPGGCLAFRAEVFQDIGGFDWGFRTWGHEDEDISIKLWLFGYSAMVVPQVLVGHLFRPRHPYRVTLWEAQFNQMRLAYSHFGEARVAKVADLLRPYSYSPQLAALAWQATVGQRAQYFARRVRSDDWFMERFGIPF